MLMPNKEALLILSSVDRRAEMGRDSDSSSRVMAIVPKVNTTSKSARKQWHRRRPSNTLSGPFNLKVVQCEAKLNSNVQVSD